MGRYDLTVSVLSGQPAIPQSGYVSVISATTNSMSTATSPAMPVTTAGVSATTTTTPTTLSVSGVQVVDMLPTTGASVQVTAMPGSSNDKPVTDEWLASLEKQARERWIL